MTPVQRAKATLPSVMREIITFKRAYFAGFILLIALAPLVCRLSPAEMQPRTVDITAKRFAFEPAEITLKKGQPVELRLSAIDVSHGLRFRELGVDLKAKKGSTSQVQFTPEKAGSFVGHCSVFCGSGHGSMRLTLHVVP